MKNKFNWICTGCGVRFETKKKHGCCNEEKWTKITSQKNKRIYILEELEKNPFLGNSEVDIK